jgi:ubiquinol-cytochrome c reductase cytochrome b subunit
MLSIPVVGAWAQFLLFGGEFPGEAVIHRLYVIHILLVPALIAGLIGAHMAVLVRQKHSQFPAPGHTQHNVVGSKMWPTYAFRSLALLCAVCAVVFALGGLAQINPIWLWGPFSPAAVTAPAQPDWYVGWVEGALRVFPPVEFRLFGYLVPAPFLPGVALPGLTFLVLYLWPWLDRRLTGDRGRYQLLDRPRDHPGRVAVGAWALSFYALLLAAGADDVAARVWHVPVLTVMRTLRVLVLVVPFAVAAIAYLLARALRDSRAPALTELRWKQVTATVTAAEPGREEPAGPEPVPDALPPGAGGHADVPAHDAPPVGGGAEGHR